MKDQLELFPTLPNPKAKADKLKRRWESGFQKWSDDKSHEVTVPEGACGYGAICDDCDGNPNGRPCVRALNEYCRRKRITIDYTKTSYEDAWWGRFNDE